MNIIYEINPPKIFYDSSVINFDKLNQEIKKFLFRTKIILEHVNYLHITDSVLGIPRISSIHGASIILENITNQKVITVQRKWLQFKLKDNKKTFFL